VQQERWIHLPPAGQSGNSLSHLHPVRGQVTYNADTGDSELEGHVVLDGGLTTSNVEASHGTYKSARKPEPSIA